MLVGAQAICLRVGEADLAVAPYTTDGNLVLDPTVLGEIPPLERALRNAGFSPKRADSVGIWIAHQESSHSPQTEIGIDLFVPESVSPGQGDLLDTLRHGRYWRSPAEQHKDSPAGSYSVLGGAAAKRAGEPLYERHHHEDVP